MYNAEQKTEFIRDYTKSLYAAKAAEAIFNKIQKYEKDLNLDISAMPESELQKVVDTIAGLRLKSLGYSFSILKDYVKWCIENNIKDANNNIFNIKMASLDNIRKQMVSSPLHFQKCLDDLFNPVDMNTVEDIYRCYFWMAYVGILSKDAINVKTSDVDLQNMEIHVNDSIYPIYREALPAFKNVVNATSFKLYHPMHDVTVKERIYGDQLVRGLRGFKNEIEMGQYLLFKRKEAEKQNKTDIELTYTRIWLSGLFYRTYEYERMGVPPDFTQAAMDMMRDKEYKCSYTRKPKHIQNMYAKGYMEDYSRWKLAFAN